jgi:hypothetical protein
MTTPELSPPTPSSLPAVVVTLVATLLPAVPTMTLPSPAAGPRSIAV